jgi:aspartyl-tRNA(Asn)/glutamyl-tRNA(Gln) amidotransferase subunit A
MAEHLDFLSLTDLLAAYRSGRLSPVEVVASAYARLRRLQPVLNAFCHVANEADTMRQAAESEARWRAGRPVGDMDGVPIHVKDAILAKGWPTLKGSRTVDPAQAWTEDGPAVARMREHNAIILGKTTTPEFGWTGVTHSPLTGITRNPWNVAATPGGSSGGAAAALAAGIGHGAIGTDAGGSVRIPAGFCGLVAMKATCGRVPNYPPSAVGTLGHIGPIARTVRDAAHMLNLMSVPDARDWLCLAPPDTDFRIGLEGGVRNLRIAYSPTLGYAKVEPAVAALVAKAAQAFVELGAQVEEVSAPFPDPTSIFRTHFFVGMAHSVRTLGPAQRELLDPDLQQVLGEASKVTLQDYLQAVDGRAALGRASRAFHERYDLLLTPTLAVAPFEAGRIAPAGYADWMAWTPFTYPLNLTGQPAATVPCGVIEGAGPVGLQIVGGMYQDAVVLRAARAYESTRPAAHPDL